MRKTLITAAAVGALVVGGGVAYAAIPGSSGVIKGCYDNGGNLRVIDESKSCPKGFTALSWNQQGVPGEDGADGAPGTNGAAGYEIVTRTFQHVIDTANQDFYMTDQVVCPAGKVAAGGGGRGIIGPRPDGSISPAHFLHVWEMTPFYTRGDSQGTITGGGWRATFITSDNSYLAVGDEVQTIVTATCINRS